MAGQFALTVIDAEAGIEQVNRRVMSAVDRLLLVSDTSLKGLRVAETICQVAQKISGPARASLLLNRVRGPEELRELQARTALEIVGWIPEDETIRQFDAQGRSFLELPASPAAQAIVQALASAGIIP